MSSHPRHTIDQAALFPSGLHEPPPTVIDTSQIELTSWGTALVRRWIWTAYVCLDHASEKWYYDPNNNCGV